MGVMSVYFFHIFYICKLLVFDKIHTPLDQGYNTKLITVLNNLQFIIIIIIIIIIYLFIFFFLL